jgi:nitrite reductase/ring-hydroxylating ferredoxin subunit
VGVDAPIVVGRASDVAEPGAFFTHDGVGVPILVTRDRGGVVHAMLNVCRHRGTRLASTPRGVAEAFVCPLHAWTYDLCGRFGTVPISRCDPRARRDADTSLVALPCAVRHGFVFVVPSTRVRVDLDAMLATLDVELASLHLGDRSVATRETAVMTWAELGAMLGARRGVTWIFPGSLVYVDGEDVLHVAVQPLAGEDVEVVTARLRAPASRPGGARTRRSSRDA